MSDLLTKADLAVLNKATPLQLAEWWCRLNHWAWPEEIPDPEPSQAGPIRETRRMALMEWIEGRVAPKLISRIWNHEMNDAEFAEWWARNGRRW